MGNETAVMVRKGKALNLPHTPCRHRRRETRDGVTLDWCYAIGCEELGDMPCDYCTDREGEAVGRRNAHKKDADNGTERNH